MLVFFFNDTATTEIYTLSLHDALPILPLTPCSIRSPARSPRARRSPSPASGRSKRRCGPHAGSAIRRPANGSRRSEEHTSELQSRQYLVCRLLLEKKT